ncbi:MAG: threonine-phosphate decarboxylase CobD [Pseudomonadota bacterium]
MNGLYDMRHGGALDQLEQQFPRARKPWIDLSTGINPWPWPVPPSLLQQPGLLAALPTQRDWQACRTAMATSFGVAEDYVLPVPGTAMAIALLPHVIPADEVACLTPSYGDHERSWRNAGARISALPTDLEVADSADAAVLCNPNNPDGRLFCKDALRALHQRLKKRGGTLIVDEAYGELCPDRSLARHVDADGLVVLRSFGKFFGLAGVRLGAVIAAPALLQKIAQLLGDWPISSVALKLGAAAYCDQAFAEETRARLARARERLDALLEDAGITVSGGTDLFRYIEATDSHALWESLARSGIYTRRFEWTQRHLRLGLPANTEQEDRLKSALKG